MTFRHAVYAKYVFAETTKVEAIDMTKIKSFAKKAIIPLLLALGPVACGTQPDGGKTVQNQMNNQLDSHGISCKITLDAEENKGHWTFVDDEGSSVVLTITYDENGKAEKDSVEVTKQPSGEKMENFTDAVMTTFKDFGPGHISEKYDCDMTTKGTRSVPTTSPNLP